MIKCLKSLWPVNSLVIQNVRNNWSVNSVVCHLITSSLDDVFFPCQHAEISMNIAVQGEIWALTWHPGKRDVFWFPCRLWGGSLQLLVQYCSLKEWTNGVIFPLEHTAVHTLMLCAALRQSSQEVVGVVSSAEPPLVLCWLLLSEPCPGSSSHRYQGYLSHRLCLTHLLSSEGSLTSFV